MKNIILIRPPETYRFYCDVPEKVESSVGCFPSLGIMYIASYLEQTVNVRVNILDMNAEKTSQSKLRSYITQKRPELIGIQTTSYTYIDALFIAKLIKQVDPAIKVVLGGVQPTMFPVETLMQANVDFIIAGEAELSFAELVKLLDSPDQWDNIEGLGYKLKNDEPRISKKRGYIKDLDTLPFPARYLTKYKKYYSVLAEKKPITSIISSRGCPFRCTFCDRPRLDPIYRPRKIGSVIAELNQCVEMGIREFSFYDNTFTVDRKRTMLLCKEIIKNKLDINFDIKTRTDCVDKSILSKLSKTGCKRIYYGIESSNQENLNTVNKNNNMHSIKKAIKLTKQAGINILAYYMIGLPGETRKNIFETIKFAKELNTDYALFSIFTPLPSTQVYEEALENEFYEEDFWRSFAKNPNQDFKPKLWTEFMNEKELNKLETKAYNSFYYRPEYFINRLLKIKTLHEFRTQIKAGVKMLGL